MNGSITYNGHSFNQFVPVRTASYINQYDTHLAELTVRETLDFSARCQGPGSRPSEPTFDCDVPHLLCLMFIDIT